MQVRLQKLLAEAGVASRRASERLILDGLVQVNDRVVTELGTKVDPDRDQVKVEGRPIKARRKIYVALHKPKGFLTTRSDDMDRRTVGDLLPPEWAHLHSVGRLDLDSEGLLFLTNDGDFTLRLTHPRFGVRKHYRAIVEGRVERQMLSRFMAGVEHDGETLRAERAILVDANNSHSIVELELAEGRNREVRRLFESEGLTVERLQRTQIGPIRLGEMPVGRWRVLTPSEVAALLRPPGAPSPVAPRKS